MTQPDMLDSVNPSYLYLNNWSDGDPEFTLGPPKEDVVMQGKLVWHAKLT